MTLRAEELGDGVHGHQALRRALARLPWLPYRRGFGLELEAAVRGALSVFEGVVSRGEEEGRAIVVVRDDEVVAALTVVRQRFDSEIFGIPMASSVLAFVAPPEGVEADRAADLLLETGAEVCRDWGVHHWSVRVVADDTSLTQGAIRRRWFLADSTLDYTWELRRPETRSGACSPDEVRIRFGGSDDAETLSRMAYATYTTSVRTRYATDPWLPLEGVGRLYARWAELACAGSFADAVAVAEVEDAVVGFDMLKLNPSLSEALGVGFGHKGIAAVAPSARGKSITSCLEAFLNRWQHEAGGHFNTGRVLINNIPMQLALAKVGGVATAAFHTFHAWVGPLPTPWGGGSAA